MGLAGGVGRGPKGALADVDLAAQYCTLWFGIVQCSIAICTLYYSWVCFGQLKAGICSFALASGADGWVLLPLLRGLLAPASGLVGGLALKLTPF